MKSGTQMQGIVNWSKKISTSLGRRKTGNMANTETNPPLIGESTKIKIDLKTLALVCTASIAVTLGYAAFRNEVVGLKTTTQKHESQLAEIQSAVIELKSQGVAQTQILKYLANDRRGPVPDAAK